MSLFDKKTENLNDEIAEEKRIKEELERKSAELAEENQRLASELENLQLMTESMENSMLSLRKTADNFEILLADSNAETETCLNEFDELKKQMSVFEKLDSFAENIGFMCQAENFVSGFEKADAFTDFLSACNFEKSSAEEFSEIISEKKYSDSKRIFNMTFDDVCDKKNKISALAEEIF